LTSSSTFHSSQDWSEPHNLGINFPDIRHFSSSFQSAYSSEELNGLLYYQNSIFFQLQGGASSPFPPDHGLCPWTPLGVLPPNPRYRLALRARHVVPHCLEEIAATVVSYYSFRVTLWAGGWVERVAGCCVQGLKVIDLQMSDYMRHLEQAVQFGLPVLLQNVMEKLEASLDPILNKSVIHVGQLQHHRHHHCRHNLLCGHPNRSHCGSYLFVCPPVLFRMGS